MKRSLKSIWIVFGFVATVASPVYPEAQSLVINKDAEWNPSGETIRTIYQECTGERAPYSDFGFPQFGICFPDSMARAGASPQAVAFARSTKYTAYLAHFFEKGHVDLAYVHYPYRANENEGWLLVNGDPQMIDVDDLSRLPQDQLQANPAYLQIKEKYPNVMLFGGDRTLTRPPTAIERPKGGQQFIVAYRLLNGCRACERVGSATFAFDFDSSGKFLGTTLLDVK